MKILAIDDCDITLDFIHHSLEEEMPEVDVTTYDSERLGRPGPDFDWQAFDGLLLDYHLGHGETGVDWLNEFGARSGFPRTILITSVNDPYVVANAIRVGADGYLNKADLTPQTLAAVVRDVIPLAGANDADASPESLQADDTIERFERERRRTGHSGATYRFGQLIGRGAMSSVYIAERVEDGATTVLKILDWRSTHEPDGLQRFVLEGKLLSALNTPYVVKIYDQGFTNSYGYIAMEFFGRGDLKQRIEHGIAPADALLYLQNIAFGLQAIHEVGIVHRDLKPANIMFRSDESMALADFGISKRLSCDLDITSTGSIMGTPHYMSPEQARGESADARSDLYSAGIILYHMLTGSKPFRGDTISAVMFQHIHADPPVLPSEHSQCQVFLSKLVAKNPDDRYQSAAELCTALAEFGID